jgi:ketosteroid isomerase-like protein
METNSETTSSQQELVALEHAFWRALQSRDLDTALALTDDPCIVTGPQGHATLDKKTFASMFQSEQWQLHRYEFLGEPSVLALGPDLAIVAYKVREEMTVEGEPLTLEAADASTWIRRDGQWRCALHTESLLGDPFGRDRRPS